MPMNPARQRNGHGEAKVNVNKDLDDKATKATMPREGSRDGHDGHDEDDEGAVPTAGVVADRYPNRTAQREMDRQEHIRRAEEMGATHGQATRHADEELGGH